MTYRGWLRLGVVCLALTGVASCGTGSVPRDFCLHYIPIPTDDGTPERIQLAIDDNNVAYLELCE